jgi:hypothetical protein
LRRRKRAGESLADNAGIGEDARHDFAVILAAETSTIGQDAVKFGARSIADYLRKSDRIKLSTTLMMMQVTIGK